MYNYTTLIGEELFITAQNYAILFLVLPYSSVFPRLDLRKLWEPFLYFVYASFHDKHRALKYREIWNCKTRIQ